MGIVINLRGTAGSGKTELVRRILADYGWKSGSQVELLYREGRIRPIAYRLPHPSGGRPLAVLGHYEETRGGCDTIGLRDGGLDGVFRLAGDFSASGHDVLLEGLVVSSEYRLSVAFARTHVLHVLRLDMPIERSIRNLITRRRAGLDVRPHLVRKVTAEHAAVVEACERLKPVAAVEALPFDDALRRVRDLLGLEHLKAAA